MESSALAMPALTLRAVSATAPANPAAEPFEAAAQRERQSGDCSTPKRNIRKPLPAIINPFIGTHPVKADLQGFTTLDLLFMVGKEMKKMAQTLETPAITGVFRFVIIIP